MENRVVSPRPPTNSTDHITPTRSATKTPLIRLSDLDSHGVIQLDEPPASAPSSAAASSSHTLGARMKLVRSPPRLLKLRDSHFLFLQNSSPDDYHDVEVEMSRNEVLLFSVHW